MFAMTMPDWCWVISGIVVFLAAVYILVFWLTDGNDDERGD
jgi:hypothetical protein